MISDDDEMPTLFLVPVSSMGEFAFKTASESVEPDPLFVLSTSGFLKDCTVLRRFRKDCTRNTRNNSVTHSRHDDSIITVKSLFVSAVFSKPAKFPSPFGFSVEDTLREGDGEGSEFDAVGVGKDIGDPSGHDEHDSGHQSATIVSS